MKLSKKYDILATILKSKITDLLWTREFKDTVIAIGACHKFPSNDDIDFISTLMSLYILHVHEVDIDSEFPDIMDHKREMMELFALIDELKENLKIYSNYFTGGNPPKAEA